MASSLGQELLKSHLCLSPTVQFLPGPVAVETPPALVAAPWASGPSADLTCVLSSSWTSETTVVFQAFSE